MKKFIDLSLPIEAVPSEILIPEIEHIPHKDGTKMMQAFFGCKEEDLPNGLGWATDTLKLSTHCGTHLDAPYHYHPTSEGKKAKTISEIPLEWCYSNGVVLDMRHKEQGALITVKDIEEALEKINYKIKPFDIVLFMTGADKLWGKPEYFDSGCGLDKESTLYILNQGVKITGIDAWTFDRPFKYIREEFDKTKNAAIIWSAHFAGIEKEYCHIEKLCNLDKLPPYGFTFVCFPIKIKNATAAWCRCVAIIEVVSNKL